jgi:hypothetical protein
VLCMLTLDGVPLGHVELTGSPRGVGQLVPLPAYSSSGVERCAKRLGLAIVLLGSHRIERRVAARSLAGAVAQLAGLQQRLGLLAVGSGHVAVVHIVVTQLPRGAVPMVVADLREQAAPVGARPMRAAGAPGGQARPAA